MKSLRFLPAVLLLLCPMLVAQSAANAPTAPKTEAQTSFDALKTLAGEWEGPVTVDPPIEGMNMAEMRVVLRVTSKGNAIVHEMQEGAGPFWMRTADVSAKNDHPVTMLYLDGGQLNLVHYCDAGNRPHMLGKASPDGKKIAFDFVDITGGTARGYMYAAAFTPVDANRHFEDWTFRMPGDKLMHAHFDLHRVN